MSKREFKLSEMFVSPKLVPGGLRVYYKSDRPRSANSAKGITLSQSEAEKLKQYESVMDHWFNGYHEGKPEREPVWAIWGRVSAEEVERHPWMDPRGWTAFEDVYIDADKIVDCPGCEQHGVKLDGDYLCIECRGIS